MPRLKVNGRAYDVPVSDDAPLLFVLRNDIKRTSEDADIRQKLAGVGMATVWIEGKEMDNAIDRDLAKWTKVVREANIKAD